MGQHDDSFEMEFQPKAIENGSIYGTYILRLFQHTFGTHPEKNLYQRAIKGVL